MAATQRGFDATFYVNATPTNDRSGTGTWVECKIVSSQRLNLTRDTVEILTRELDGFKERLATGRDGTLSVEIPYKSADAAFAILETAADTGATIGVFLGDGPIATAKGWFLPMGVDGFDMDDSPNGASTRSLTLSVRADDNMDVEKVAATP